MSYKDDALGANASQDEGEYHVIQQGECVDSLAHARGHFCDTLWQHPKNAQLKQNCRNSNILFPGDVLFIPPIREGHHLGDTGMRYRFVRRGLPIKLKLRILRANKPRRNEPFRLLVSGSWIRGITDENGSIEVPIPPGATRAELYVGLPGLLEQHIDLFLGGMDPINEPAGIQKRLKNLGYDCEVTGLMDEQTRSCIEEFQSAGGIEPTGEVDEATSQKLLEMYGS